MNELELLRLIRDRARDLPAQVKVGPGDDCAVVAFGDVQTLLTVDQLVGGRHFDIQSATLGQVAHKALGRSVSDIAAMGGSPALSLVTGLFPPGFDDGDALLEALTERSRAWSCPMVGGDIAVGDGPLSLTATVIGEVRTARGPVLRSEAREGDGVYVTGRLGGSLASGRHLAFEPRVREGAWLSEALGDRLGAMIDLSDGLGLDGARVAEASGVRIVLEGSVIPLHEGVADWRGACSDGEDYELLFTAQGAAPRACDETGVSITQIGEVTGGSGCVLFDAQGAEIDIASMGWNHGAS